MTYRLVEAHLMRIEVGIKDDHSIRSGQVNTDATSTRTKNIDEDIGIRLVKLVHVLLPLSLLRATILHVVRL
jgi:hypothetical protein